MELRNTILYIDETNKTAINTNNRNEGNENKDKSSTKRRRKKSDN